MPTRGGITADAFARFCNGIVDAVAPYAVAVKPQLAFFEALGADGMRALEEVWPTRDRPACSSSPTASAATSAPRPGVCGRLPRGLAASRRRADGQPVSRPRLPGAVARGLPPPRGRRLLPRQDVQRRRRDPGSEALRRPAGSTWRSWSRVGRTWSASGGFRASAPSWARHIRVPSARHAASCRSRSCSSRASAPRALPRETSHAPSRVGRPARSSLLRGRSSTPSGRRPRPTGARRGRRGSPAEERDLGGRRLVSGIDWRAETRRYAIPVLLLLLVTVGALIVRDALDDSEPGRAKPAPRAPAKVGVKRAAVLHLVESGDTLGGIAERYGTTVARLHVLNRASTPSSPRGPADSAACTDPVVGGSKLRLLALAVFLSLTPSAPAAGPSVQARAYLVADGRDGHVLAAEALARSSRSPASPS